MIRACKTAAPRSVLRGSSRAAADCLQGGAAYGKIELRRLENLLPRSQVSRRAVSDLLEEDEIGERGSEELCARTKRSDVFERRRPTIMGFREILRTTALLIAASTLSGIR